MLDSDNGPEDRQRNIIQRLSAKASKPTGAFGKNYRHRRPDQPRPTAPPPPYHADPRSQCCQYQQQTSCYPHIVRNTRLWAISETCITHQFRFTVPGFDVIQHPATGPGRRGIALGIPSCFGGHEHGSAVGTMILAKVPNFTPESRALLTSPRVDRQTAVADHFVIRNPFEQRLKETPVPRAPTISPSLSRSNRSIATSNYWDVLADGAQTTQNRHRQHPPTDIQFLESANAVADNESSTLPPATRSNRRLLSGTTKRAILASKHCTASIHCRCNHQSPTLTVQCNTLRDEWSRLKAAATQLERVDGRKQWVKHADNLTACIRRSNRSRILLHVPCLETVPVCCSHSTVQLRWHSTVRPNIDPACHARSLWITSSRHHRSLAGLAILA
ncbi:hypothetical protein BASA81_014874 [Batrachochytrium salamandrivorans]|nr:hypothetical protein BASA81_014874 [Batrachochytrium salamandrivorans]